mmetsp:Transcript_99141/g.280086  ORF Transcript_99141/g.280086 Transcript_99141/m.280086 type:complete len:1111 (+) Transcript_99141:101-3433(+)
MASDGEFVDLLRALQSNDNAIRNAAEKNFEAAKKQGAVAVSALFRVLVQPQLEEPVREQAAVLLRQLLCKVRDESSDSAWSQLGAAGQAEAKAQLLQCFEAEQQPKVRRKVADIVQAVGNAIVDIPDGERPNNCQAWSEMMPALMRIIVDAGKPAGLRADALWAVKELQCSVWQVMLANSEQTLQVLKGCLSDTDQSVQANAAALFCEMIDNFESKDARRPFTVLTESLCQVLKQLADGSDNKNINAVLQCLVNTTETADFFKDAMIAQLLPFLSTVAKTHAEEDTQRLALEVMITFGESKSKAMAKVAGYLHQTVDVCVNFMLRLSDDVQTWSEADDEDDDDEESFTNGKEVIDRLGRCMAKVECFPQALEVFKAAIAQLFQNGEWKSVVAGLTTMAQIVEFVDDEATVLQMLGAIQPQFRASHPRVRFAAWTALTQFSVDNAETVTSETMAPQLLPEFLHGLDDQVPRVLERCMEAFQHFGESVERELLEPFVQPMMEKLGALLQSTRLSVKKKAITFIAVIAGQVEDSFAPYYGPLMPIFKQLVEGVLHKVEERVLLGKLFECISLLATAVGPATFRPDAEGIMQAMIQATQVPNLPSNDPVKEYMLAAAERICTTMKGDFLPFVPHILPGILEKLALAPKEYNERVKDGLDEDEEVNLTLLEQDGQLKVLIMGTSEMEDLQNALSCVHTFVKELGKHFAPFVGQTAQGLLPVFEFSMGEEIRDLAFETWGELCNAARESGQTQILSDLVQEFLKRVLSKMTDSSSVDLGALKTRADGVVACLKNAGPGILSPAQLKAINDVAVATLSKSFEREQEAKAKQKGAADDDDDVPAEDDSEEETALRIACCEMCGVLMRHHPDAFASELLQETLRLVQQLLQSATSDHGKLALYISCDLLEHLQQRVTSLWAQFLPQLLQGIVNPLAEIRQPSCYGASLAAKDPAFASMAAETAAKLAEVVTQSRTRAKKKSEKPAQACADNALSALLEILTNHPQAVAANEAQLWGLWLQGLPCQEDEQEGVKNHGALVRLTQGEKREVIGEGGANFPQILTVLIDVYKTDMADEATSAGIGQLVLKLGETRLQQLAGGLKEKQQKKLMRIHREAQVGK